MIDTQTKLCCLMGHPVSHSLSPRMHQAAFTYLGLNYVYLAFDIMPQNLEKAVKAVAGLNILGANVTIPYKKEVSPWIDYLDPLAREAGAINTIVNRGGALYGYNTDIPGVLRTLQEHRVKIAGSRAAVLGAGGAGQAVALALVKEGASVTILNRHPERATEVAAGLQPKGSYPIKAKGLTYSELKETLGKVELVVNTTSVGMKPLEKNSPVPRELIPPGIVILDLVYNPPQTRLLVEGKGRGAVTISGLEVLLYQGALSFELWTETPAPIEIMRAEIDKVLQPAANLRQNKANLALIGFMGAGKTSVGQILSSRLGKEFIDLDRLIELEAGKPISQIFAQDGEIGFRELEIEAVKKVSQRENLVIACGGGVVLNQVNIDRLRRTSIIIYLEASAEAILERTRGDSTIRPLIGDSPAKALELMRIRKPLYISVSDMVIDSASLNPQEVAEAIIGRLRIDEGQIRAK